VAGPVRVEAPGPRHGQSQPLREDQARHRVGGGLDEQRSGAANLVGEVTRQPVERPHERARAGGGDRPVQVLHGWIGLAPRAGGLAKLERRLGRKADGPAPSQEDDVVQAIGTWQRGEQDPLRGLDRRLEVVPAVRPPQRERAGGEAGLHDRLLVGELQEHGSARRPHDRRAGHGGDRHRRHPGAEAFEHADHLGGGPGARQRHHDVIVAGRGPLGGREGVRLPEPARLAQQSERLGHVEGGAAANHSQPPARQEGARVEVAATVGRFAPDGRLAPDLVTDMAHS
jgi:hypothetical protein